MAVSELLKPVLGASALMAALAAPVLAQDNQKRPGPGPDVLVLGDSQISFGAGRVYNEFFSDIENRCRPYDYTGLGLPALRGASVASLGVRSTGLHSWVATDEQTKKTICEVDKKYGVNAGVYGVAGNPDRKFVQMGKGPHYQFCTPDRSPFQEMFGDGYYTPDLFVMAFLGNATERWANNPTTAQRDVTLTLSQLPRGMPCIFMTTVPVHGAKVNAERAQAQANIKAAFERFGRCSFVEGFTPAVISEIEGNAKFFSRRDNGSVKDPFHPKPSAVRRFVELNTPSLCRAVFDQLNR